MKLEDVQNEIDQRWGSSEYSREYDARPDAQRDAHHATLHVTKALGKLASALDGLDHGDSSGSSVETALADIVICTARVASRWPNQRIDLGEAVRRRIESKFPAPQAREEVDALSKTEPARAVDQASLTTRIEAMRTEITRMMLRSDVPPAVHLALEALEAQLVGYQHARVEPTTFDWKVSLSGRSYFFEGDFSGESFQGPVGDRWTAIIKYDDGAASTSARVSNMLTRTGAQHAATNKLREMLAKASPQAAEYKTESHDPCAVKPGTPKAPDGVTATVQNILQTEAGRSSMRIEWKTTHDGRRGSFRVCNLSGSSYKEPDGTWCAHAYLDHMVHLGRSECASITGLEGIALTDGHATQERAQEQLILLLDLAFSHTVVDAVRETATSYRKLESLRQVAGAIRERAASPAPTSGVLPMSFEEVIPRLRNNSEGSPARFARVEWISKGMWIESQPKMTRQYLVLCTADGGREPWACSPADVLAWDWVEVPAV